MDKAMARAKHAASRRGRRRFSHARQSHVAPASCSSGSLLVNSTTEIELDVWEPYSDVLPLDKDDRSKSHGLDYGELLSQDPFYSYGELSGFSDSGFTALGRGLDPFEDAFHDIYSYDSNSLETNTAAFLSLDLDQLGESLAKMALSKRLFLHDETLPLELLDSEDNASDSRKDDEAKEALVQSTVEQDSEGDLVGSDAPIGGTPSEDDKLKRIPDNPTVYAEESSLKFVGAIENVASTMGTCEQKAAEDELDALLNMLDNVSIKDTAVQPAEIKASSNQELAIPDPSAGNHALMTSGKDIDWSPDSRSKPADPVTAAASADQEKPVESKPRLIPPSEEEFDAWLDSLE